ncbi:MAG: CNNM domain-containing protein, partial [Actinomyces sp.]
MNTPFALATTVVLLAGNAFFVGAEFAVTSSRRSQLEPLAGAGDARAATALWALEHISRMLATAQLGVTVCSTGLGVVAEPAIARAVSPLLENIGLGRAGAHAVAVVAALVLVVYIHVVAGEMVPKNMSIAAPERAVRLLAPPLVRLSRLFGPVITALNGFANWVLHLAGLETREEVSATFNAAEVASIVERSTAEGVLEDDT